MIVLHSISDENAVKLMHIYAQSNRENIAHFFPDCTDETQGMKMVETEFTAYIKNEFFAGEGNAYYVLEVGGAWVSALRLHSMKDFYYMEALETAPEFRNMGYGSKLLSELLCALKAKGAFVLRDNVDKENVASLALHKKCGFKIAEGEAFDYLSNEPDPYSFGMIYSYSMGSALPCCSV